MAALGEERIITPLSGGDGGGSTTRTTSYDPVGSLMTKNDCTDAQPCVSTNYAYDDNDRLLTENGFSYTYDNNGNMLTKSGNGEQWQLAYNALNQLTRANISGPQRSSVIDYTYDHDGIRICKTVNGTDITNYVVDKNRPYAQVLEEEHLHGGLSAVTSYVYGDALISSTIDGTLTQYYHTDGMGSVRGLSDSSGVMAGQYSYDAYGLLLDSSGASANPYRYRGEQYDSDLESYYLRARYYQPGTGRFLTTDPVEGFGMESVSLHRYLYGNDNPVNMIDPSGRMSVNEAIVTTAIIGNLSAIAIGTSTEAGQQAYADFGEYIFPDAFILGGNINCAISLLKLLGIPPLSAAEINVTASVGAEMLFSVTSGQIAFFTTKTVGGEIGIGLSPAEIGLEIYRGSVWNLWNALDYEGPFHSLNFNIPWSFNYFMDAQRGAEGGSWGIGRPLLNLPFWKSPALSPARASFGYNYVDYRECLGVPINLASEADIVLEIIAATFLTETFITAQTQDITAQRYVFDLMLDTTLWVQTGLAKFFWNNGASGHGLQKRQNDDRPKHFQSGPGLFSSVGY